MKRKRIITLMVVVLAIAATAFVFIDRHSTSGPLQKGDRMPNISMEQFDEEVVSLGDFQNDVIVLNVWASWCEPCVREMPELMAIDDTNDTVDVVTVNMLTKEYRASDPVDFIEEIGLTLPVLFDEDGAFIREVEPSRLPMTYLLDSNLHIQDVIIGEVTQDLLMERIDTAFAN
ncbi:TlpA family protein disulfide reductase [Shouchella hunanensis]|uniref:TlpA disulfide reductase family protein n=1 Tax=Shouchella hunanensis TaxID=766894 RepID=A0ABY7W512_9BACI|nr:TlpA disulfide reductase family protein [Shouchella hunanensis]WDF03136.1 TlpA disulfide reductase family protein [Shouchella hunanensis]